MRQHAQHSSNSWTPDEKVVVLWSTMYGLDGTNGLNGTMKNYGVRISALESLASMLHTIARLVWWLALGLLSLSGFLLSDTAAKILARIIAP